MQLPFSPGRRLPLKLQQDCPPFQGLHHYVPLVGGASLTAARTLTAGLAEIAICWDGGRHHAQKSRASGFCYVADCILLLLALKRSSLPPLMSSSPETTRKSRTMYLDLDLHFSDAVSQAFYTQNAFGTSQILTLSIHHSSPGFFPISSLSGLPQPSSPAFDPFTLAIPLHRGASDTTYARIWPIVENLFSIFDPDFIVVQCGVDALSGDPCKTFNWSLGDGVGSLSWYIGKIKSLPGKKLFLGGGGYNSPNAARAWTYLTSVLVDNPLPLDSQIPDHTMFPSYAPSFTLDVPAGNMQDENTEAYLTSVENCFQEAVVALEQRLNVR
ncbi:hypothetical protein HGRIS_000451 [Hohenbuehelia grisea]|uniref:Histone deacetylase domain-containing protein n=2 Tax=Hohenbuehelia grisea TaxID=104357 RepID=A0ABR3JR98_9AGAR